MTIASPDRHPASVDVDDLDDGVTFWSSALDAKEEPLSETSCQVYCKLRLPDSDVRIPLQRTPIPRRTRSAWTSTSKPTTSRPKSAASKPSAPPVDHQQERGYDFWVLRDPGANEFCVLQINFSDLLAQRPPWPDLGIAETGF